MAGSLEGGEPKLVVEHASNAQFADGRLLIVRDGNLLAQRFDTGTLALEGPIVPVAQNVDYYNLRDVGDFSAARSGLVAFRHETPEKRALAWFDRDELRGALGRVALPGETSIAAWMLEQWYGGPIESSLPWSTS